ncbi:MaoC family dehydratase [Saccharothrix sp.]|uniref:MaoC family dehydratase n=1 Tax=Saccharothrix sp. TaxID=1873460 RepID=UPI002810C015|nr:MaoC family dehydratase [Saccharothrix sp.]
MTGTDHHTPAAEVRVDGPLPPGYRRVATGRVREVVGLGYHEFTVGLIIEHRPGRTVTDTDNLLGTMLTGNPAPIHTDAHYAAQTPWGRILVCSAVTLGIVAGMTVRSTSGLTTANLGLDEVRFTRPVFVGDTLYADTEILSLRPSNSRPDDGIVTCATTAHNQHGEQVLRYRRTFLVPRDPDRVRDATHY